MTSLLESNNLWPVQDVTRNLNNYQLRLAANIMKQQRNLYFIWISLKHCLMVFFVTTKKKTKTSYFIKKKSIVLQNKGDGNLKKISERKIYQHQWLLLFKFLSKLAIKSHVWNNVTGLHVITHHSRGSERWVKTTTWEKILKN